MMQKTRSESVLNRWQERFALAGSEMTFRAGTNLYDKDVPLAAEVGKKLGVDIPITEQLAATGKRLAAAKN
jgi:hypothetical protein